MNYEYNNRIHKYWIEEVFPYLQHHITVGSFDDYLKRISFLPCGKWLKEFSSVKLLRLPLLIDPAAFVKTYEEHCVTYCCPTKPEDSFQRIIYQMSPTLHMEVALYAFMEKENIQTYATMFICFENKEELLKFLDAAYLMRRKGNTDDLNKAGFAGMARA